MKFLRTTAIVIILVYSCANSRAQGTTSQGTEFWTAFMANTNPPGTNEGSVMDLYITSNVNTSGTVSVADGSFSQNFSVTANQVTVITIPASAYISLQGTFNKGIHITSLKPVAIYAHIFANSSSGATLLLPVNTLGKDYYSINYTQSANEVAYSAFMVIATEDSTTVEITPSAELLDGHNANSSFSIALNKGQVYQALADSDLTGTRIQSVSSGTNSCKKIAVFSGSSRIQISCIKSDNSSDNLFQQVYPTASWGKDYITVPLKSRDYDIFRIVLSNPNSNVTLNGNAIPLNAFINGFYYQFDSSSPNYITSDQPIQVVQYAVTQGNGINCVNDPNDVGDPEMIFLTPLEQTLDQVTLYATHNYLILQSYINVLIKKDAVASFTLDGQHYTNFSTVPTNTLYSYAQIPVNAGAHNISADDGFNAITYGFGQHESYGYAAGANLQDLANFIALENPQTNIVQSNGCTGVSYNLQVTIPFKTTNIQWDFMDGSSPYVDANPVIVDSTQKGTQTLYTYNYPKDPVSYKSGSYSAVATVFNPIADVCGSTETIELDYTVSDPPVAKFSVDDACFGDSTSFTDLTTASNVIKSWLWDFGDNQTSTLENPMHKYVNPGDYKVSLTVTDVDSCTDVYTVPDVHIDKKPIASFTVSTPDCGGQNVVFTDQSTSTDGSIVKWIWDFGDGTKDTLTSKTSTIDHIYSTTGTDTVKLTVVNSYGCSSPVFSQPLIIDPSPQVGFVLPDVCLADAYARFTDTSTIADNTAANFTYLWNFGDPNANSSNPDTSTQKDPKHKYSAAANYNVSLTVTSKYGCSVSKTQEFTVNGSDPIANFNVENANSLCSSDDIVFDDESTVNFGNITKIIWYFDYNNNPQDTTVYYRSTMPANRKYQHNYGLFNTPMTKTYEVRMDVYSGQTCINSAMQSIVVNANPIVTLPPVSTVCQGAAPFLIAPDTGPYTGSGIFSGPGISSAGLFDPAKAGPGISTISYTFTNNQGCTYTTSEKIRVDASPVVSVDSDLTLLQGAEVRLKALASGTGLTYKWVPSTGLSNDSVLNPIASPTEDTQYTLTVTSADTCTSAATVSVHVLKNIVVPNAFTPNGDGINDTWVIKYLDQYPNCTVNVYNRYGQKVYSSVGYTVPWDGTYKGAYLPAGTYYYIIEPKSGRQAVSGYVAIIK